MSQAHDAYFKAALQLPGAAEDLLRNVLPADVLSVLDLSRVETIATEHVMGDLQNRRLDALFKVARRDGDSAYVLTIVDHKSEPDRWFAYQGLRYMLAAWELAVSQEPLASRLPGVIAVVICHADRPWKVPADLHSLVDAAGIEPFVPQYQYIVFDLHRTPSDVLTGHAEFVAALLTLKYVFDPQIREQLLPILRQCGVGFRDTTLHSLIEACPEVEEADLQAAVRAIQEEERHHMPTLAEKWRTEGEARGQARGKRDFAMAVLDAKLGNLSAGHRASIERLGVTQLDELARALAGIHTTHDLDCWLAGHTLDAQ